jgi:hypothetical protein
MLYSLAPRLLPPPLKQPTNVPPGTRHRERICERIKASRPALTLLVQQWPPADQDLVARANSLLLYMDGVHDADIAHRTGLSVSAVYRVRRRFAQWGLSCLGEPEYQRPKSPTIIKKRTIMAAYEQSATA